MKSINQYFTIDEGATAILSSANIISEEYAGTIYHLALQSDGNIVLYAKRLNGTTDVLWSSDTSER